MKTETTHTHTQGPWEAYFYAKDSCGRIVATVGSNGSIYSRIESFLNGNIIENRRKLAKVSHKYLVQGYKDLTRCNFVKAHAFADYIKGVITFQQYCDASHQPPSRTI